METNYNIQTGRLIDENGKNFDITVILNFPTEADFASATGLDDFPAVNLIDFYFGNTNDRDTEAYVKQFVEKQTKLRKLISKLIDLSTADNESELAEQIDFVKSLIVTLH
jgi:predicted PolB exonuclease-like 3'-5' exonuclease